MGGSYTPQNTGDWRCAVCGLYQSVGQAIYLDGRGPLCLSCVPAIPAVDCRDAEIARLTSERDSAIARAERAESEAAGYRAHIAALEAVLEGKDAATTVSVYEIREALSAPAREADKVPGAIGQPPEGGPGDEPAALGTDSPDLAALAHTHSEPPSAAGGGERGEDDLSIHFKDGVLHVHAGATLADTRWWYNDRTAPPRIPPDYGFDPTVSDRDAALEEVAKALIARGYHETSDALQTVRGLQAMGKKP